MRWTEGYIAASERPWRRGPCRGRSAWHAGGWVSREPGRPHRLHLKGCRGAGTGSPSPRPWTWHLASGGANPQVLGWYRRAKATKRGGMGGEESERLILPVKRGNHAHDTPWREGGAGRWTRWRERRPTHRGWSPSPRHVTTRTGIASNGPDTHRGWHGSSSSHPGPTGTRRRVAKPSVEEPDAAEPARPDLWGARVSNDPGLPDRRHVDVERPGRRAGYPDHRTGTQREIQQCQRRDSATVLSPVSAERIDRRDDLLHTESA